MRKLFVLCIVILMYMGCASVNQSASEKQRWVPKFSIQGGINHGGIVENTKLFQVSDIGVDAFTGATSVGYNTGIHTLLPVFKNFIEVGIDYMYNGQTFTYNDDVNGFSGTRQLGVSQLMLPTTFNFAIFRKKQPEGLFQFKIGHVLQYNMIGALKQEGFLPAYTFNRWSNGVVLGLSILPFHFGNGSKAGFYFDLYRGKQIYNDFYNTTTSKEIASSYMKFGFIYQF